MSTSRIVTLGVGLWAALPAPLLAQDEHGVTPVFSVNLGTTVWTTVVFLLLLGILWKFAWNPILGLVEARETGIQNALDEAARERDEARKLLEEHRQQMAEARRQAQALVAEGREAGERLRQEIEEKARAESQAMLERARQAIEREKEQALDALRRESVDLAIAAAGRLIQERLDSEKDRDLVRAYLEQLGTQGEGAQA
ncbi:MAG: ATP synthase F0 subunit B [Gemmatimonadetes bacterium]|nr:MAG: ATP synthase F0 subunit B [Gemmatimonadota bacterium]